MENGTEKNLYDIIFPDGSPGLAVYIFIGLLVSLTVVIVLYFFYAVVLKKLFAPKHKTLGHIQEPKAAQQYALEELHRLQGEAAGHSGSLDAREYAYVLSRILKTYISSIYNCNALHSSYLEIVHKVPKEQQETVAALYHEIYKIEFTPESAQVPALLHICELTESYIIHSCN